mgnify:CR=1 FL=1
MQWQPRHEQIYEYPIHVAEVPARRVGSGVVDKGAVAVCAALHPAKCNQHQCKINNILRPVFNLLNRVHVFFSGRVIHANPPNGVGSTLLNKLKHEQAPFYNELMDYAKEKNVPPPFFEEVGQGRWRVEFLRYNVYGEGGKGALAIESSAKEFIRKYLPESYDRLTGKSPPHPTTDVTYTQLTQPTKPNV